MIKLKSFEEFFYRPGLKDGLNMKSTVKSILEMFYGNITGEELKDEDRYS